MARLLAHSETDRSLRLPDQRTVCLRVSFYVCLSMCVCLCAGCGCRCVSVSVPRLSVWARWSVQARHTFVSRKALDFDRRSITRHKQPRFLCVCFFDGLFVLNSFLNLCRYHQQNFRILILLFQSYLSITTQQHSFRLCMHLSSLSSANMCEHDLTSPATVSRPLHDLSMCYRKGGRYCARGGGER